VFIFENSQEHESYVLVLQTDGLDEELKYEFFTLDVFSFIDVDLKELPLPNYDKIYQMSGIWRAEENPDFNGGNILSHKFVYNP
jgi:hypothetical protein